MVEWKLIGGTIPPLNETQWQEEFTKYKQFPEYIKITKGMSLIQFKAIFFWEYLHRLFGRLIGLTFIIPFFIFWIKKWLSNTQKKQLIVLLGLGALQGFLGWFMVKSGLVDIPAVSHYRLATHLITAFGLMCYIYWLTLSFNNIKRQPNQIDFRFFKCYFCHNEYLTNKNSYLLALPWAYFSWINDYHWSYNKINKFRTLNGKMGIN